jgi:hypothetical protein
MEKYADQPGFNRRSAFDDLPALHWRDRTHARAFYCDAFISHRRYDASGELLTALEKAGIRAWHDLNADLTHRKVRDHVRFALSSSRTIIVFVGDGDPLSAWCHAEFEPGLQAGNKGAFERVIVVLRTEGLAIPTELLACKAFLASDTDRIADHLRRANRPPLVNEHAIRSWTAPNLVLGALPFTEVAILGPQRLDLLASNSSDDPAPWEEWSRDLLATDLGVRVGGGWLDGVEVPHEAEQPLFSLFDHLGRTLLRRTDVLARLAPFEILDFVLAPLAWLQTKPAFQAKSRRMFVELCLCVAENSKYGQHAKAWLVLSDFVAKDPNLNAGRMAVWEALDEVYEMNRHLVSMMEGAGSLEQRKKADQLLQERQSEGVACCRHALAQLPAIE